MRNRIVALVLALVLAVPLGGCWSRIEVNDLAIVSTMALDLVEPDRLRIWLHVVVPAHAGGAQGISGAASGEQGAPFINLSAEGSSVMEAAKKIQLQLPRRIFWAHMRVILIGERLGEAGVRRVLDFLTRQREMRLTNYIVLVRGDVAELMGAEVDLEKFPMEYMRELSRSRVTTVTTLADFTRTLEDAGSDPMMAVVTLVPPPPESPHSQKPGLKLSGSALFRDDRLVSCVNESLTRGLLWFKGEVYRGVVTVEMPPLSGHVVVERLSSHVQRKSGVEKGQTVFYIKVKTEGDISEESVPLDLSDPQVLDKVDQRLSEAIRVRMIEALERAQSLGVDPMGLGEVLHQQQPAVWRRVSKRWQDQAFRQAKVIVTVDARIRRTGLSSKPRGVPEEELLK